MRLAVLERVGVRLLTFRVSTLRLFVLVTVFNFVIVLTISATLWSTFATTFSQFGTCSDPMPAPVLCIFTTFKSSPGKLQVGLMDDFQRYVSVPP